MKTRLLPLAMLAAFVVAFAGLVSACGGGDSQLSLEEYFEVLEDVLMDADDSGNKLGEEFVENLEDADDDEEEVEAYLDFFDESLALIKAVRDDVDGLNPPDEAEAEHDDFVEATDSLAEAFEEVVEDAEDADSGSEIEDLLDEADDLTEAGEDVERACADLQEIADDEDIDVDLRFDLDCGGESDADFDDDGE